MTHSPPNSKRECQPHPEGGKQHEFIYCHCDIEANYVPKEEYQKLNYVLIENDGLVDKLKLAVDALREIKDTTRWVPTEKYATEILKQLGAE